MLKNWDLPQRNFSIMGRTIHVTAKVEGIDYAKLKKYLSQFEDVSRDEFGDILSG